MLIYEFRIRKLKVSVLTVSHFFLTFFLGALHQKGTTDASALRTSIKTLD